jgi:hypothetical protein
VPQEIFSIQRKKGGDKRFQEKGYDDLVKACDIVIDYINERETSEDPSTALGKIIVSLEGVVQRDRKKEKVNVRRLVETLKHNKDLFTQHAPREAAPAFSLSHDTGKDTTRTAQQDVPSSSHDTSKGRATSTDRQQWQIKDDERPAHQPQEEQSDLKSHHKHPEPTEHTQEHDLPSDYVVPKKHIKELVGAVIASKLPGAPNFNSRTFLQDIGADPTKTTVVIADEDMEECFNYARTKTDDYRVTKALNELKSSTRKTQRKRNRIENMTTDAEKEAHRAKRSDYERRR